MSLAGFFDWLSGEVKYAFFIAFLIGLAFFAFKRAWLAVGGFLIGMTVIAMFIVAPENMITLGEWLAARLNIGG